MVVVVMTTYDDGTGVRYEYARRCHESWCEHARIASQHILLADDGSPDVHQLDDWEVWNITGVHNGVGASLNRALAILPYDEPWIYTTDDWLLTGPLDLELPLWLLGEGYDIVRLGPLHPNLMCWTKFTVRHGWWLDITQNGHGFIFATRPFLASARFMDRFGPFDEGLNAYETERLMAERFNARGGRAAAVALHGPWEHIGVYEVGDREVVT